MTDNATKELRLIHHIVIGADRNQVDHYALSEAYDTLKEGITRHSGGTVALITDGTWTINAEAGDYLSNPVEHDIALNFIVTLTYEEVFAGTWEAIKQLIAKTVKAHKLPCHHIHVAMWIGAAKHFHVCDVDDSLNASNDNDLDDDGQEVA